MEAVRPEKIVKGLCAAGFPAYYVGGCVRDRLLGRPVHDWDVTTAALPEEVMALFERCVPTGIRHGTVTVFLDGAQAEVTTFRTEGVYLDGRHPSEVRFVRTLAEDLSRRDFTINAMAMDADGNVTDLFGGRDDLARRCIRCVGDPEKRFREDALRMLRAYRFSAQLGFALDAATAGAVERCAPLAAALSMERIRDEMEKTLLSPRPPVLRTMADAGLLKSAGIDALPELDWLAELPTEPSVRWAGLKVLFPELEPSQLRLPSRLCSLIGRAASAYCPQLDRITLKRAVAENGTEAAEIAAALAGEEALFSEILASGECVTLGQLAVSGSDLSWLRGREVGQMLHALLAHVLRRPEENSRETLLKLAQSPAFSADALSNAGFSSKRGISG